MNEGLPKDHWKRKLCLGNEPPVWFDGALFLVGSFGVIIFLSAVYTLVRTILFSNAIEESGDVRGLAFIIFGLIGLPFVIWRAIVAQGNLDRSKDRDYADLFTKAVEQLGATREKGSGDDRVLEPNIEVRVGAIYALERISRDSERDHIAVIETLCAYIRNNFEAVSLRPFDSYTELPSARIDLQVAVQVIGRRSSVRVGYEIDQRCRLDLSRVNFTGVDFSHGKFNFASFRSCRMFNVNFESANLNGAQFDNSIIASTSFFNAAMKGTSFDRSNMSSSANFYGLDAPRCCITAVGAELAGADLDLGDYQYIFGSSDTEVNSHHEDDKEQAKELRKDLRLEKARLKRGEGSHAEIDRLTEELVRNVFGHWSNSVSWDGYTVHMRRQFLIDNRLTGWPYQ